MSQFRRTDGNRYTSQWNGDDLNTGDDPDLPRATILSGSSIINIVGPGVYSLPWGTWRILGDGKVIIYMILQSNTATQTFQDVEIRNFALINGNAISLINCIVNGAPNLPLRGTLRNSLIIGNCNLYTNGLRNIDSCIFDLDISSPDPTYLGSGYVKHTFISGKTKFRFPATDLSLHEDNLCNGLLQLTTSGPSEWYEAKQLIDGSPRPDADPLIDDIADVFPNFYLQGNFACIDEDLKIIDLFSRTVEPDSVLLQKSGTYGYIGGVKPGKKIDLDESGFTITKTGIDDSNPNSWKVAPGVDYAKVRITGKVSDSLISAQTLDIRIPFNFDGSQAGGSADNNNVPDAWNARTTPDTKGTMPNRLTFEVRSSLLANPGRDNNADWDNDNGNSPSIAGRYYLMEYGHPLLHHVVAGVAYGNSEANAIDPAIATIQPFNYRSLDIIITITNDREI